jgi:hypothetical protein
VNVERKCSEPRKLLLKLNLTLPSTVIISIKILFSSFKNLSYSWIWRYILRILALGRLKQEIVSSRPAWGYVGRPYVKKQKIQ